MAQGVIVGQSVDKADAARRLEQDLKALFESLANTGAGESARRIMDACLFLREHKAKTITASAVGDYCRDKFGGPLTQSIRNKQDTLLRLVKLHSDLHDLQTERPGKKSGSPRSSLRIDDPGVAAYVMVLEARVRELERSKERLTQAFKKLQPLQIGAGSPGASVEGAHTLPSPTAFMTVVERDAAAKFLDVKHLDRFGLKLDDRQRIVDGSQVLVESPVVRLLTRFLQTQPRETGAG